MKLALASDAGTAPIRALRWIARAGSLASLGLLALFATSGGDAPTAFELVLFAFFPIGVAVGMLLAWFRELLGGSITLGSLVAFVLLMRSGVDPPPIGPWFFIFASPGLALVLVGIATRWRSARVQFIVAAVVVIPIGLGTRRFSEQLPWVISEYAGDVLWPVVAYGLAGAIAPRAPIVTRSLATLGVAYLVEFSQLWHPGWLDAFRATTPGHLLLGVGFEWSDLPCYTLGVLLAAAFEAMVASPRAADAPQT